ncbi:16S rRNA (uracil(1498)-N(3))-methyltransferase [Corynebacterium guangdongense]|uniref:Ribosomal RNA small subunit methyltransferase E n=1 Tax=Corynebacterium guangdongense TaxID=1783348 RepID=A0ABU2A1H6_9CORY|nr:16S rRNA (uracil(1498)-N(3))-methyltransferase [Corynebacterium guangdongense]MDR7329973.1 16S rRNA (uracil1498-N3)-methyltransferase [Corynebacterium guangdongense]WJZ18531.1 Ribosomal RNA small subunit methyltransferase E [Corynebacterium guangdongense]
MSLPVFLTDSLEGDMLTLTGPEGRHAVTVKRIQPGEHVLLADGTGLAAEVEVTDVSGRDTLVGRVVARQEARTARPRVVVVQALPKSERSELAVDLATQAGADEIIPWQANRCEAKWVGGKVDKHVAKWASAAASAAKQSRRFTVPRIHQPMTTRELSRYLEGKTAYILHEDAQLSVREIDLDAEEIYLLVGPEGGIGADELATLGVASISLGPEVYRTASAAMVALSAIGALRRW